MIDVRTSAARWRLISGLLSAVERTVEGASRLDAYDAYTGEGRRTDLEETPHAAFGVRMCALEDRIDREIDRLTAELLIAQLQRKRFIDHGDVELPHVELQP